METQTSIRRKKTYVYVIGAVGLTAVKIGTAHDPVARLQAMQCGSPVRLAIMWTYEWWSITGGAPLERALHQKFADCRLHGEWFDLGLDPVPAVRAAVTELIGLGLPPELKPPARRYRKSQITPEAEETRRIQQDLAEIFTEGEAARMFASDLAERLRAQGSPYAELSARSLYILIARHLGRSQSMTIGSKRGRGYHASRAIARLQTSSEEHSDEQATGLYPASPDP